MKRLLFLAFFLFLFFLPNSILAQTDFPSCASEGFDISVEPASPQVHERFHIIIRSEKIVAGDQFSYKKVAVGSDGLNAPPTRISAGGNGSIDTESAALATKGDFKIRLFGDKVGPTCEGNHFTVAAAPPPPLPKFPQCPSGFEAQGSNIQSTGTDVASLDDCQADTDCFISFSSEVGTHYNCYKAKNCVKAPRDCPSTIDQKPIFSCADNQGHACSWSDQNVCNQGGNIICAKDQSGGNCKRFCSNGSEAVFVSQAGIYVCNDNSNPTISPTKSCPAGFKPNPGATVGSCNCEPINPINPPGGGIDCSEGKCSSSAGQLCDPALDPENFWTTDKGGNRIPKPGNGVMTAIGCIPTDPKTLITKLMGFSAGIGGGIALLLMVFGAFQMMTAAGNPEAIKKGKDQFLAAAIGLLFVIFSALLLRIIGVDILNIPGFS